MSSSVAMLNILTFDFKRGHFNIARRGHYYFALTHIEEMLAKYLNVG